MPAELKIVTEAEVRACARGELDTDRTADVMAVIAVDERARAMFETSAVSALGRESVPGARPDCKS